MRTPSTSSFAADAVPEEAPTPKDPAYVALLRQQQEELPRVSSCGASPKMTRNKSVPERASWNDAAPKCIHRKVAYSSRV
eukprot:1998786-Amphidinium_carterae.1